MAKNNDQLYAAIMGVQNEVGGKIDILHNRINDVVEKRITPLEIWKSEITGKLTLLMAVFAFGFSFITEWIKSKFFKNL